MRGPLKSEGFSIENSFHQAARRVFTEGDSPTVSWK
jgi:hypothetical protein